jgi:hypothetical protein
VPNLTITPAVWLFSPTPFPLAALHIRNVSDAELTYLGSFVWQMAGSYSLTSSVRAEYKKGRRSVSLYLA